MTRVLSDEARLHLRYAFAAQVLYGTYDSIGNRDFRVRQVNEAITAALDAFEDRLASYVAPEERKA